MLITELPGCITRPHACAAQYEPLRLMSTTALNSSGVSRVAGTAVPTPALLTRTSTRPNSVIAASTIAWQSAGSATSVATARARRPAARTSSQVCCSLSTRRAASTRSAPASAQACANETPSPEEAPVTMTTLSSRRKESSTDMTVIRSNGPARPVRGFSRCRTPLRSLSGRVGTRHSERGRATAHVRGRGKAVFLPWVRFCFAPRSPGSRCGW